MQTNTEMLSLQWAALQQLLFILFSLLTEHKSIQKETEKLEPQNPNLSFFPRHISKQTSNFAIKT